MIEIKIEEDDKPLSPDGVHSREGTRAIASGIDEACRLLNYATMSSQGLTYPSDVYSVLGALAAAMGKTPQALRQMDAWMKDQVATGQARENAHYGAHGGDAQHAYEAMSGALRYASGLAAELGNALASAQAALSGMESTRDDA